MKRSSVIQRMTALGMAILLLLPATTFAQDSVKRDILLRITAQVTNSNAHSNPAKFDLERLQSYPVTTIRTDTPWTDGVIEFEGVLLRDLLSSVKFSGQKLIAEAINDYFVTIPMEDILKHDVIIAYKKDGKLMSIRDKGPLWIIYPWRDNPDLKTELHHSRSIWQLISLHVE